MPGKRSRFVLPISLALVLVLSLGALLYWKWRQPDIHSPLRVGVDHAPPYNLVVADQPVTGLAVEVLEAAARRKGIRLEFVRVNNGVDAAFRSGLVDIWPAATDTKERRAWLHVTTPWLVNGLCIVSRKSDSLRSPAQLVGKRVAAIRAGIVRDVMGDKISRVTPVIERDRESTIRSVCAGSVDAALVEQRFFEQTLLERLSGCEGVSFSASTAVGAERMLSIISTPEVAETADLLRRGIGEMVADTSFFRILDRWSAYTGSETRAVEALHSSRERSKLLGTGAAAGIVLLGLLLLQNRILRRARQKSTEATRVKSDFLASVSHELRTPMNGILGMAQILLDTPLNPEQREQTQIIRQSAESLLRLINDILDASKMEAGKLRLEPLPFDPRLMAEQVHSLMQPQARGKGLESRITISPGIPPRVVGDADRVRQILINLLGNAVKFTERGSVWLNVNCEPADADKVMLVFEIGDTGIGISAAKIGSLFQMFYQADTSSRRQRGGTGLGLAISRQLARMMDGDITVQSEPRKGTVFTVRLPFRIPVVAAVPAPMDDTTQTALPLRVLLVEDNLINQRVAHRLLERLQCVVDIASNGQDAVRMATANEYSLIFMDCQMPGMDGFEATRNIRQVRGASQSAQIIALTASNTTDHRDLCRVAGMNDFVAKPIHYAELSRVIQHFRGRSPVS